MPKAYAFTEYGGPETQVLLELPKPVPGYGQLLVAVRAAGVNPVDWKTRAGYLQEYFQLQLPAVMGQEVSGVVEEVGEGVEGFTVGDEVFGKAATGGFAEYALVGTDVAAQKPAGMSFLDAATLFLAAGCAYQGVHQLGLSPGDTLLINGVGGGVGVAAAQIAQHQGLNVVGTASAGKREFVESLGVRHVPSGAGVADRVRAAHPGGFDAIIDLVGGAALRAVAAVLTDHSKAISAVDPVTVSELGGSFLVHAGTSRELAELAALVEAKRLDPVVTEVFPLERAGDGIAVVEGGHARGKVVIQT